MGSGWMACKQCIVLGPAAAEGSLSDRRDGKNGDPAPHQFPLQGSFTPPIARHLRWCWDKMKCEGLQGGGETCQCLRARIQTAARGMKASLQKLE